MAKEWGHSSLMSHAQGHPHSHELDFYRPTLDVLMNGFGQDRLLFGSNWPPARSAGSYREAVNLLEEFFTPQGASVQDKFFSGNAYRVYQL